MIPLNKMIDHTKLGANVTLEQIDQLIEEAKTYDFKSVCVNPIWVRYAKQQLKDSDVLVCTVVGFPHGTHRSSVKAFETKCAIEDGADEIDMVINVYQLKSQQDEAVYHDIISVIQEANNKTVKVIIETCYLNEEEIKRASEIALRAQAHFVKTSTGFGPSGAKVSDVVLMKSVVGHLAEVKASGGVRTYEDALIMIEAGATRIGTSNGVQIIQRRNQNDSNTSY